MIEKLGSKDLYRVSRLAGVVRFGVVLGLSIQLEKGFVPNG